MSGMSMDLKNRIATSINELNALAILFPVDVARRLHVTKAMVVNWHRTGVFRGTEYVEGDICQVYYLSDDCDKFAASDVFTNAVPKRKESSVDILVHGLSDTLGEKVYTTGELCERLSVSMTTLNRWSKTGVLVPYKFQRDASVKKGFNYYTESQVQVFLDKGFRTSKRFLNSDLIGTDIGKLHVRGFSESAINSGYYGSYVCECDCGRIVEAPRSKLLSGKFKSCGCRFHDLTGRDFGRWHVDGLAPCTYSPGGTKLFQYYCTCACGTKRVVTARSLRAGVSQSCGCLHKEIVSDVFLRDLTGMTFGDLHVESRAPTRWSSSGRSMRSMWNCRCKCGTELVVSLDNLVTGHVDSCGCGMNGPNSGASKYEFHVRQYLESIGLFEGEADGYVQYKSYPDLVGVGGGYLLYDFYVTYGKFEWLIECQGEQHYKSVAWFGGDEAFQVRQEHDKRKRMYATDHGISFIEVPYTCLSYEDTADLLAKSGLCIGEC